MQDGWKKEIADVLRELRIKEKVQTFISCQYLNDKITVVDFVLFFVLMTQHKRIIVNNYNY